jgi:flagellar motor switch protein FliG
MKPLTKQKNKEHIPFSSLFGRLSPGDFYALFREEYPQTIAFILSFAPNKGYAKKVLSLTDKETQDAVKAYLSKRRGHYDPDFAAAIEDECLNQENSQVFPRNWVL